MNTNYYFLKQLAPALKSRLQGGSEPNLRYMECFSQDRDELVLIFAQAKGRLNYYRPFYVKATLRPDFSGLLFPEKVQRARINSVNLFESVIDPADEPLAVIDVRVMLNERCLAIALENNVTLVFKFFGNRPNLLLFKGDEVADLFNHNLLSDHQIRLNALDRPIDQSYAAFEQAGFDHRRLFPTFGKLVNDWLIQQEQERGGNLSGPDKWALIQECLQLLENPRYYVTRWDHKLTLSLLPVGEIQQIVDEPIDAANRFFIAYTGQSLFAQEQASLLRLLEKRKKRAMDRVERIVERLIAREEGPTHEEMGHLLMANLHDLPTGPRSPERIAVYDFYRDQPITLRLKTDMSPQKNAENFYRKAKNEKKEEQHLNDQLLGREAEASQLTQQLADLSQIQNLKELRRYVKQHNLLADQSERGAGGEAGTDSLFKEIRFEQFRILIGRNARNNDLLTQKYAYKDDLWLHARDVAGSHVLIKYQAGKPFPKTVIERAAELAAWYSKRRTDSLCPVTVTPKKFVRKPKGLAEGQVLVEKEDVILVEPRPE